MQYILLFLVLGSSVLNIEAVDNPYPEHYQNPYPGHYPNPYPDHYQNPYPDHYQNPYPHYYQNPYPDHYPNPYQSHLPNLLPYPHSNPLSYPHSNPLPYYPHSNPLPYPYQYSHPSVEQCSNGEVLNECASLCLDEPTCQNLNPEPSATVCPAVCVRRCECDGSRGLIRDEISGQCVDVTECVNCNLKCGPNEREGCESCCNNDDVATCSNLIPGIFCECFVCNPACVCAEGYVRDTVSGQCVLPKQCPPCY